MAVQNNGQPVGPVIFTDDRAGKRLFVGPNTPGTPVDGDIWFDSDIFNNAGKNFISGVGLNGSSTNLSISFTDYKDVFVVFRNVQATADANITITINGNTTNYSPTSSALFSLANVKTGVTTNHWSIEIPDVAANAFKWAHIQGVYTNTLNAAAVVNNTAAFTSTDALSTMNITTSAGTLSGTALVYGVN